MKTLIAAIALAFLAVPAHAADDDADGATAAQTQKPRATVARQESLEMPGITACHQCEWRPKPHTKAALEQCGTTPDGAAKTAIFECGFSPDCDRVCNFVSCTE